MEMTDGECGWLAGIIDGEGCVTIRRQTTRLANGDRSPYGYHLYVVVQMCHYESVLRCQRLAGVGSVRSVKAKRPGTSESWVWEMTGAKAIDVLREVYDLMITKRAEVEVAFRFQETIGTSPRVSEENRLLRAQYFEEIRALKPMNVARSKMITS